MPVHLLLLGGSTKRLQREWLAQAWDTRGQGDFDLRWHCKLNLRRFVFVLPLQKHLGRCNQALFKSTEKPFLSWKCLHSFTHIRDRASLVTLLRLHCGPPWFCQLQQPRAPRSLGCPKSSSHPSPHVQVNAFLLGYQRSALGWHFDLVTTAPALFLLARRWVLQGAGDLLTRPQAAVFLCRQAQSACQRWIPI